MSFSPQYQQSWPNHRQYHRQSGGGQGVLQPSARCRVALGAGRQAALPSAAQSDVDSGSVEIMRPVHSSRAKGSRCCCGAAIRLLLGADWRQSHQPLMPVLTRQAP